ncbi:hypothetical protein AAFF_G00009930 [Aldrovandia affinis]|uniref:PiggyBac transposable element-derived protein domain-containing protein n=1 Tax=Aldrovandia affinis TaxID=143900 RepID=A0AAD7WID4_9TELE|nr:hypothetical protein AAFF_G00009930 [Aldrovandia affinis]
MVSYVLKARKAVVLHDKADGEASVKKKPEVIQYYNNTKGGVVYKRQTRRWPMVQWYNLLDVAILNAYTFIVQHPNSTRRLFIF